MCLFYVKKSKFVSLEYNGGSEPYSLPPIFKSYSAEAQITLRSVIS